MSRGNRTYGPFRGMMSSVERDVVPIDRITGDSENVFPDPLSGGIQARGGCQIAGDVAGGSLVGLLESKFSSKARQILEMSSPSITDGLPTRSMLLTNETTNEGTLYWADSNRAVPNDKMQLGKDFGTAHYPSDAGTNLAEFIMLPLKTRHSPTTGTQRRDYTRAIDAIQRKTMASGSRKAIDAGAYMKFPNYSGTPLQWNKVYNPDSTTGDNVARYTLWGNQPPLAMPITSQTVGSAANWLAGKKFYISYMYKMADGSYTKPVVPRPVGPIHTTGYGLVTIAANCDSVNWSGILNGPDGTVGKVLLRTAQVTGAAGVVPSPGDLRICGYINNNTTTTYTDTNSDDGPLSIVSDPIRVRIVDPVMPWRGRYAFTFDERYAIGYIRPNPSAFYVAQFCGGGVATATTSIDSASVSATTLATAVREDQTGATVTQFVYKEGATEVTLSFVTYPTLQDLMDKINSIAPGTAAPGAWRAQLYPGVDQGAPTAQLDLTQLIIPSTTNTNTTVNPQAAKSFANVQVGMRVTGTNIPAGTYVTAVSTNITISAAATGTGNVTLKYGWETGDGTVGEFRGFSGSYPCPHYFKESYLDTFADDAHKRTFMFTSGEPGHARNASNSFYADLKLTAPSEAGIFMGGSGILNGQVLGIACYSKQICVIHNPRGGNTALDADIRLRPLNRTRGCLSSDSIVAGDGWVGYLTEDGYVVTDGISEIVISRDVWNVGSSGLGAGEWDYEISQCRKGCARDTDDEHFHAMVAQGTLYVSFRSDSAYSIPNHMLVYDFSPGLAASGLSEVTLQAGEAYGWSAKIHNDQNATFNPGTMGVVRKGAASGTFSGLFYYFADDTNGGSTGDGRMQNFNRTTYTDDGTFYLPKMYLKTDRCDTNDKKTAHSLVLVYTKGAGSARVVFFRDRARLSGVTVMTLPSSAVGGLPARSRRDIPITRKNPSNVLELLVEWADIVNHGGFKVFQAELDVEVLEGSPL